MEDYEKLGSFYLGRVYDLDAQKAKDELLLYDFKGPDHPCGLRRHDRQRQDGSVHGADRRGRHRRRARDPH